MFSKEKKPYDAPDIEKIPLSDEDLDKVSGGVEPDEGTNGDNLVPDSDSEVGSGIVEVPPEQQGWGNADVGSGRGRGGGCDGELYHRVKRSFSARQNSGC